MATTTTTTWATVLRPDDATVPGDQLRPGDVVLGLGGTHRIDHFGEYPGRFLGRGGARIAYDAAGRWRCTVADQQRFHVVSGAPVPPRPGAG